MFFRRRLEVDPSTGAWRPITGLTFFVTFVVTFLVPVPDVLGVSGLTGETDAPGVLPAVVTAGWVVLCLGSLALVESRPWVGLAAACSTAVVVLSLASTFPVTVVVVLGGVAVVAAWRTPRVAALACAAGVVATILWAATGRPMDLPFAAQAGGPGDGRWGTAFFVVVVLVMVWFVVRSHCHDQRRWLDRTLLEAREGRVAAREGVLAERARLARDLHDVVAHHVSLIAVRAETAPYSHPDLDPAARTVLADVATDARLALDELRGVLGLLGRAEEGARTPQPTWSDVPALVERSRAAGAVVELTGDVGEAVPPSVGYVTYRVVQEALTNARRHAPGLPVAVALDADADGAAVTIRNPVAGKVSQRGAGRGLPGMRERVEGLGGRLTAGPREGEFVVEAVFGSRA